MPAGAEDPEEAAQEDVSADRDVYFAGRDINIYLPDAGWTPATSAYLSLVRDFAPPELLDRQAELTELAEFSAGPGPGGYLWWRAAAWAGKSALLAWFSTHPPDGVRVVSFFATGRYAGHDTWEAFTEVVVEQLAALRGEPIPPAKNAARRILDMRGMLDKATEVCREQGESLVLVVDGLDEDRQAVLHSIAGLLPSQPPYGLRVVVASRPHPPIPSDVPTRHSLRDPGIVRELSPFPKAWEVQHEAEGEMDRLLRGAGFGLDVVGFLVAANGGLTSRDLAVLTTRSERKVSDRDVEEFFRAVSGRTFSCVRSLGWAEPEEAPQVFLFGHTELQRAAASRLGVVEVARYRDQIHEWAGHFQSDHWPDSTPEYLLRGYFSMLKSTGDIHRMVRCALDPQRRARIAELVGSDSPTFAEIESARDAVHAQPGPPDLRSMALLTVNRDMLRQRSHQIPVSLPAAWAAAGYPVQADHMVNSIMDEREHVRALCEIVGALARHHRNDLAKAGAQRLVVRVTNALRTDTGIERELADVVGILTKAGFGDEADAIARMLPTDHFSLRALGAIFRQRALSGRDDRVAELADEITSRAITLDGARTPDPQTSFQAFLPFMDQWQMSQTLACLATVLADAGFPAQAGAVRRHQTRIARRTGTDRLPAPAGWNLEPGTYYESRKRLRGELAEWIGTVLGGSGRSEAVDVTMLERCRDARTAAQAGKVEAAKASATRISDPVWRARCLAETALAIADVGALLDARDIAFAAWREARSVTNGDTVLSILATAADALAAAGHTSHVQKLARMARRQVTCLPHDAERRAAWGRSMVRVLAANGELDTAWKCIPSDRELDGLVVGSLVVALADHGELTRALEAADSLTGNQKEAALAGVAQAAARQGDLDTAELLLDELTDPRHTAETLATMACAHADAGEREDAKELIDDARNAAFRMSSENRYAARPWSSIARAWIKVGDRERALQAARTSESITHGCQYPEDRASMTVDTVEALAIAGLLDDAECLARSISDRAYYQATALAALVPYVPQERAATLVADALHIGGWRSSAGALAAIAPDVLADAAEECCSMLV